MPKVSSLRDKLNTFAARAAVKLLAPLPFKLVTLLAYALGVVVFATSKSGRRRALANLELAYGSQLSSLRKWRIALGSYMTMMAAMLETVKHHSDDPADIPVARIYGLEHLEAALAKGKGVILVSGHYGSFGFLGVALSALGYNFRVVTKELPERNLGAFYAEMRQRAGVRYFQRDQAPRLLLRHLQQNGILQIMVDQTAREGRWVKFFGLPFRTYDGAARLARTSGAVLLPAVVTKRGLENEILIGPELECEKTSPKDEDLERCTQAAVKALEDFIRARPELWYWVQKPWRQLGVK